MLEFNRCRRPLLVQASQIHASFQEGGKGFVRDYMYHVLACGDSFSGLEFPERDRARERLREKVAETGLTFVEHYWVWDETHRAQLLVASTSSSHKAEQFRILLEKHGIGARITSQLPFYEPPISE